MWIDAPSSRPLTGAPVAEEKLGALGVHLSRWVSSHGFAYNVSTDLRFYDLIVPCGIVDKGVTSLERILGRAVSPEQVAPTLISHFAAVFDAVWKRFRVMPWPELLPRTRQAPELKPRRCDIGRAVIEFLRYIRIEKRNRWEACRLN